MMVAANGSIDIGAGREAVWAALHDPQCVAACVPGCESARQETATRYSVRARIGLGPLKLGFEGEVAIEGCEPLCHLALVGKGHAGRAGAATGTASIRIHERTGGCRLVYEVEASLSGPLAQFGPNLLDGMAHSVSEIVARRFAALFDVRGSASPQTCRPRANASRTPTISSSS